ncbi:MAG: 4-hydroxy-3-methylbut-2-enyl diphosphate reductase [Spirochaetes bacterium]|nr:4-hydroxy-3-methylbut-2-enyl diphosphate reductase [Spirochaetota bacterium]
MTRVLYDKHAGLCAGVKRTIRGAVKAANENSNVTTFGELVHNPIVTGNLKKYGIAFVHSMEELSGSRYVIIRAHGIPPKDEDYLRSSKIRYLDLTCPRVKIIHRKIDYYSKLGYKILIVGYPEHAETKGHLGHAGKNGMVVSSPEDISRLDINGKILIVAQTTISEKLFNNIIKALGKKAGKAQIVNSICPFVLNRLRWIRKYSKIAEASVIIGGFNSSNTKQLYETAETSGKAFWIAYPDQLNIKLLSQYKTIALTAGASTPDTTIREVLTLFKKNNFIIEEIY